MPNTRGASRGVCYRRVRRRITVGRAYIAANNESPESTSRKLCGAAILKYAERSVRGRRLRKEKIKCKQVPVQVKLLRHPLQLDGDRNKAIGDPVSFDQRASETRGKAAGRREWYVALGYERSFLRILGEDRAPTLGSVGLFLPLPPLPRSGGSDLWVNALGSGKTKTTIP